MGSMSQEDCSHLKLLAGFNALRCFTSLPTWFTMSNAPRRRGTSSRLVRFTGPSREVLSLLPWAAARGHACASAVTVRRQKVLFTYFGRTQCCCQAGEVVWCGTGMSRRSGRSAGKVRQDLHLAQLGLRNLADGRCRPLLLRR